MNYYIEDVGEGVREYTRTNRTHVLNILNIRPSQKKKIRPGRKKKIRPGRKEKIKPGQKQRIRPGR